MQSPASCCIYLQQAAWLVYLMYLGSQRRLARQQLQLYQHVNAFFATACVAVNTVGVFGSSVVVGDCTSLLSMAANSLMCSAYLLLHFRHSCVRQLCTLPAVKQLDAGNVEQVLRAAEERGVVFPSRPSCGKPDAAADVGGSQT
jgi:hypothetical protein